MGGGSQKSGQILWSDCPIALILLLTTFCAALGLDPLEGLMLVVCMKTLKRAGIFTYQHFLRYKKIGFSYV